MIPHSRPFGFGTAMSSTVADPGCCSELVCSLSLAHTSLENVFIGLCESQPSRLPCFSVTALTDTPQKAGEMGRKQVRTAIGTGMQLQVVEKTQLP